MATSTAPRRRRRRPARKKLSRSARKRRSRPVAARNQKSRESGKPSVARRRSSPPHLSTEIVLISVSRIDPAPWGTRLVYSDIRQLADSIRGDGETEGVGILEPVLVRPTARGRYELLDGARRLCAAKQIAEERGDADYRVPARIFNVPDHVARLIAAAAEVEQDRRKPIEVALLYQSLREALERETGQKIGIRTIAGIGWHGRSMVRDYLTIGRAITREMLRRAGIVDASGKADELVITKVRVPDLLAIAAIPTVPGRVSALRAKAGQLRGARPAGSAMGAPAAPTCVEERLAQFRDGGLKIRVRAPIRTLAPATATELVRQELAPAIVAAVDQAHGGVGGEGYFADVGAERTILVLPREVEALSALQLANLAKQVDDLQRRVRRALRRRGKSQEYRE